MTKKTAPDEVIIVGYFLAQARSACRGENSKAYGGNRAARAFYYVTEVMEREQAARDALRKNKLFYEFHPSPGLRDVMTACNMFMETVPNKWDDNFLNQIQYIIGDGHSKLSKMMCDLGYKTITARDLVAIKKKYGLFGGGGGR